MCFGMTIIEKLLSQMNVQNFVVSTFSTKKRWQYYNVLMLPLLQKMHHGRR
jgi:hypothetical protein